MWNKEVEADRLDFEVRVSLLAKGTYCARRIYAGLLRRGQAVARCSVVRLMRTAGPHSVVRTGSLRTTHPALETCGPVDLGEREFATAASNQLWVADITCRGKNRT